MQGNEGMNDGHAYTVLGAKEIDGERYVIMRNPYGNMVAEYDEKGKLHRTDTYMSSSMNETYGQFIIKLDDFLKNAGIVTRLDTKKMGNIKKEDEKKNEEEKKSVVPKAQIDNDVDDF